MKYFLLLVVIFLTACVSPYHVPAPVYKGEVTPITEPVRVTVKSIPKTRSIHYDRTRMVIQSLDQTSETQLLGSYLVEMDGASGKMLITNDLLLVNGETTNISTQITADVSALGDVTNLALKTQGMTEADEKFVKEAIQSSLALQTPFPEQGFIDQQEFTSSSKVFGVDVTSTAVVGGLTVFEDRQSLYIPIQATVKFRVPFEMEGYSILDVETGAWVKTAYTVNGSRPDILVFTTESEQILDTSEW